MAPVQPAISTSQRSAFQPARSANSRSRLRRPRSRARASAAHNGGCRRAGNIRARWRFDPNPRREVDSLPCRWSIHRSLRGLRSAMRCGEGSRRRTGHLADERAHPTPCDQVDRWIRHSLAMTARTREGWPLAPVAREPVPYSGGVRPSGVPQTGRELRVESPSARRGTYGEAPSMPGTILLRMRMLAKVPRIITS